MLRYLTGLGLGFLYLPTLVSVGYYFDKKRALATGFSTCGSGIGTLVLAPFARYLLQKYGWKGAHFILGTYITV